MDVSILVVSISAAVAHTDNNSRIPDRRAYFSADQLSSRESNRQAKTPRRDGRKRGGVFQPLPDADGRIDGIAGPMARSLVVVRRCADFHFATCPALVCLCNRSTQGDSGQPDHPSRGALPAGQTRLDSAGDGRRLRRAVFCVGYSLLLLGSRERTRHRNYLSHRRNRRLAIGPRVSSSRGRAEG
ncbi:MAG: hypothetical protein JMDDDDMK_01144 [Acidobacteria bacterium]|nr:hypothetical protein [Acidobacteriota bacterium]